MNFCDYRDASNPSIDVYRSAINTQARITNVPPCALAAIIEVESNGRNIFQEDIARGPGCGVGLCMITADVDWTDPANPHYRALPLFNTSTNIFVAGKFFLRPALDSALALRATHQHTMDKINDQLLFWAFAAYNGGVGFMQTCVFKNEDPDRWTTNGYAGRALALYERNVAKSLA